MKSILLITATCISLLAHTSFACTNPVADSSRIAVAGGSLTEIIYQLGANDRIVAVDTTSTFPQAATEKPSIGYVRNLSAEGILSIKPTLILGEDDMGPPEVIKQLLQTGITIETIAENHTTAGIVEKVRCIGTLLDLTEKAQALIENELQPMVEQLDKAAKKIQPLNIALLLGIRDGVPLAAGNDTSGNGFLSMIGARNVFIDIDGWKPISLEAMASVNPDFILIPKRGVTLGGGLDAIRSHPAIRLTNAAKKNQIIPLDGMAMLGFSPRTLTIASELIQQLNPSIKDLNSLGQH